MNQCPLQLLRGILNSFTEVTLRISQLLLAQQDFREAEYGSKRSAQLMREMGDRSRTPLSQIMKFPVFLFEL